MANFTPENSSPLAKGQNSSLDHEDSFMERWLVMPKVLYFLLNMFVYTFHSLMTVYFKDQWKLKYFEIGYASSIIVTNFFGAMVWSSLADRTGRYKTIIISTALLYTIVACMLLFPVFEKPEEILYRYVYCFVGLGLFNFFLSAAFPLLDAQIIGMMAVNPKVTKEQFGNQRMFGALGHLATNFLAMSTYKKYKKDPIWGPVAQSLFQVFTSSVFILAVWLGVPNVKPVKGGHHGHHDTTRKGKIGEPSRNQTPNNEITVHQVPLSQSMPMAPTPAPPSAAEELNAPGTATIKHPIIALLTDPNFMFFMVFIAFSGIVRSVATVFQRPILTIITGGDEQLTTWFDVARTISEMFVYYNAKYMKNAMGIYWILALSQITGIARIAGYGWLPLSSSYMCILSAAGLELLKGFNSGLISSSAIAIASNLAPPGCESTAQGLYSGNYSGLSMALGSISSGMILQYLYDPSLREAGEIQNIQTLFQWVSIATTLVTAALMCKYIFVDRVMGVPGLPRRRSN